MLKLTIPSIEMYDEVLKEFIVTRPFSIQLIHSLVSISKWESKWKKAFLSKDKKTVEETIDYIRCMTITQNVPPEVYDRLTNDNIESINEYIEAPMTATIINNKGGKTSREVITSEVIYYWMISLNIPFECQKWHLNRLLTLINVCNIKNQPAKKMSRREILNRNKALNEQRRKKLNTRG